MNQKKKRYHVVRKNKADTKVILRILVCGYLLYLAWQLLTSGDSASTFSPLAAMLTGGLFGLAAVKEYKEGLKAAELTPEEEEELRRERED